MYTIYRVGFVQFHYFVCTYSVHVGNWIILSLTDISCYFSCYHNYMLLIQITFQDTQLGKHLHEPQVELILSQHSRQFKKVFFFVLTCVFNYIAHVWLFLKYKMFPEHI